MRAWYSFNCYLLLLKYFSSVCLTACSVERAELQTLWPFPRDIVREYAGKAKFVGVVEMNMGQLMQSVKLAVDRPDQVFLINRIDGELITDTDIKNTLRIIMGRGI